MTPIREPAERRMGTGHRGGAMSRPPRVLFVITSLDRGGAQRQIVDLAARLHAAGWPVAVLSMTPPAEYLDELAAAGIKVVTLRMRRARPTPMAFARYGRFVRAWKPDVIHAHMVHANLLARLGRIFAPRIPVICTVHNVNEGARWREIAYRLTDRLATMTTAVSEAAAERYVEIGAAPRGRIEAIPNGFDFSRASPAGCPGGDPGRARGRRRRVPVGDGRSPRHPEGLRPAARGLRSASTASGADARLAIAGDGPEREALDVPAGGARRSSPAATLLGDRSDVPGLLAAADGFVLSSRWEGLPMVLLEAAAQGLPIVCTDVGGDREVVRPELGGVLTDVDVTAIAEGMLRVMAMTPAERAAIGDALRDHVHSGYDMDVVVDRWRGIYTDLAGPARHPG